MKRRPRRWCIAAALAAACLLAPTAGADKLVPKKGPPIRGYVSRSDTQVTVNPYHSKIPLMKYGVVNFPVDQVKRVEDEVVPDEVIRRKHADLKDDDVEGRVGLAKYAQSEKRIAEADRLLEEALSIDSRHAGALALYVGGIARFEGAKKGNPALDKDLHADLVKYLATDASAARAKDAKRIEAERGFPARPEVLERMWRSAKQKKGIRYDVPLTLRSDKSPGGVYTIYVPDSYDPLIPIPLVFGLHGGGAGGKKGDEVVGNGRDGSSLYIQAATRMGWILVCPTALQAPWSAPPNEPFLLSVLEEVEALYHIDLDRVYLTGHSMGGFGSWWFGPRHTDLFACVAPTAGGGTGGFKPMMQAHTGIYIYHSADDPVVNVGPDQQAAKALLDMDAEFIYLQLEDRGHSFPPEAEGEMFDYFQVRRLFDAHRTTAWPRSSFAKKASQDEAKYLGDPAAAWNGPVFGATFKDLVAELERGGGGAEHAAAQIAATKPEGAVKAVAKIMKAPKATEDARAYAARCLGDLGDPTAVEPLCDVMSGDHPAKVIREAAIALKKLASPAAGEALGRAAMAWGGEYGKRLQGDRIDYPDWETVCFTLAEIVEALAVCGPAATSAFHIEKQAVRLVLEKRETVQAEARAGQDPSAPRQRLAKAVARAYATLAAPEALFTTLKSAVMGDSAAGAAVTEGRESPLTRPAPPPPK